MSETRTIKTDLLARVEGEGAMFLRIRNGRVDEVRLRIYEPPRFFEAFPAAATASPPTSPRASAASARSPTR